MDLLMILVLAAGFFLVKLLADWCGREVQKK